jgi:hypothetical protein
LHLRSPRNVRGNDALTRYRELIVRDLLKEDEALLYGNLIVSDQSEWSMQSSSQLFSFANKALSLSVAELRRRAEARQQERQQRIETHRKVACDLRALAEHEKDVVKINRLRRTAELNDAMGQTLQQLSLEALEETPTTYSKRIVRERELKELERERKLLTGRRWRVVLPKTRRELDERLLVVERLADTLRQEIALFVREEEEATERARAPWRALNDAKRMLAEEGGRAKFKQLEPDIRSRLCGQWRACEQVKKFEDEVALTMAIGDVLMTLGATLPIASISALVVKIGVKKFCNCPS